MKNYQLISKRIGAFETNSSSSHSLVLAQNGSLMNIKQPTVHLTGGDYGWEDEEYDGTDWLSKANYLFSSINDLNDENLTLLKESIAEHLKIEIYDITHVTNGDYYVDHQSIDLPQKVMEMGKDAIKNFIFSSSSTFTTSNDNSGYYSEQRYNNKESDFKII